MFYNCCVVIIPQFTYIKIAVLLHVHFEHIFTIYHVNDGLNDFSLKKNDNMIQRKKLTL